MDLRVIAKLTQSVVTISFVISALGFSTGYNLAYAAPCVNPASDSDGDGWGYENGESCTIEDTLSSTPAGNCIDYDGDGWGWNGVESCQTATSMQVTTQATSPATGACIDYDGDGWGWNGTDSCVAEQPLTAAPPVRPQVQPQAAASQPVSPAPTPSVPAIDPLPVTTTATSANNDTPSCQVVLSAGANLYNAIANNSGRICLRPGNYSLPQTLSFRSNQTLAGVDASNLPVINTSANRTMSTTGRTNVSIENLIIEGNRTGATEFGILVGNGSQNIGINNVTIRNTFGIGIGITRATNVAIRGGTITNIGQDTRLRQAVWTSFSSRNISIDGLSVVGRQNDQAGGDHAITCIDAVDGFSVTNTSSTYAGSGAIAINNCSNITVRNNRLSDGREHGVDIVNGAIGALVSGNTITGFDRSAMVFDDHSWQCEGCGSNPSEITVTNNIMSGNNRVNLARCRGIAVDSQMVINPTAQQLQRDWVRISADNQVDAGSALYCPHIH